MTTETECDRIGWEAVLKLEAEAKAMENELKAANLSQYMEDKEDAEAVMRLVVQQMKHAREDERTYQFAFESKQDESLSRAETEAEFNRTMGGVSEGRTFRGGRPGGNPAPTNGGRVGGRARHWTENQSESNGVYLPNGCVGGRRWKEAQAQNAERKAENFSLLGEPERVTPLEPILDSPEGSLIATGRGPRGGAELRPYEAVPDEIDLLRDPWRARRATSMGGPVHGETKTNRLLRAILGQLRRGESQ